MELRPHRIIKRRTTKEISVGNIKVGGQALSVQSMTNTLTTDIRGTINQIHSLENVGADIVRVSCLVGTLQSFKKNYQRSFSANCC